MLKFILIAFLFLMIFLIYRLVSIYSSKKNFFLIFSLTFFLILISILLIFSFSNKNNNDKIYNSPKFDGENIIPGFFSDTKEQNK